MRPAGALMLGLLFCAGPALAQGQPDDATTRLIADATEALFDQLPREDFAAERAFLTDELAAMASLQEWTDLRQKVTAAAGGTPRYAAHAVSYYEQDRLLAAVDFWAKATKADTVVCGYVLWEVPAPGIIGLVRLEQNVVPVAALRTMDAPLAAQLMTDWRCPKALIESALGVTLR